MTVKELKLDREAGGFRLVLGVLIALVAGGMLLVRSQNLLGDPDSWWHIKVGSDIWHNRAFPTVETYSHTFAGQPWIAKEWLSQIIWSFAYSIGGWSALVLVTIANICLATHLAYQSTSRKLRPLLAAAVSVAAVFLSSPTFLARPHIFTIPLAVYWTDRMFRAAEERRVPSRWMLLLIVLWANLHGSFTLGFLIAGLAFMHLAENVRFEDKRLLVRWIVFLVLCPMAALVHPYTWQALWISLTMVGGNEAMRFIGEWQPFTAPGHKIHEAALLAAIAGLLWLRLRLSLAKIAFIVLGLHMFLEHLRFVYVFFLLVPVAIVSEIGIQHRALSLAVWAGEARDTLELTVARYREHALAAAAALVIISASVFMSAFPIAPPERISAAGALAYADTAGLKGNVLNHYDFGGPLIFRGRQTFIDGRAEQLFLGGFISDVARSMDPGGDGLFSEMLEKYKITWTLLPPDDPRNRLLDRLPQWHRSYEDKYAVIHVIDSGNRGLSSMVGSRDDP